MSLKPLPLSSRPWTVLSFTGVAVVLLTRKIMDVVFFACINLINFLFWIVILNSWVPIQSAYVLKKHKCVLNRLSLLTHSFQTGFFFYSWLLLWIHLGKIIQKLNSHCLRFQDNELKKTIWRNSRCSKDQNVRTPVPVRATLWSPAIIRKR